MDNYQTCSSVPFSNGAAVQVLHNNLGNRGPHKGSSALQQNRGILRLMEASHANPVVLLIRVSWKTKTCYRVNILSSSLHNGKFFEDFKSWSWRIPKSLIFLVGQSPKKHQKSTSHSKRLALLAEFKAFLASKCMKIQSFRHLKWEDLALDQLS